MAWTEGQQKCTVRVEDEAGRLLGRETSGQANIRLSVSHAWQSIYTALEKILLPLNIALRDKRFCFHAGMGIAGCEIPVAYQAFLNQAHSFTTLVVTSDAHTACLGAHGGNDGAIIIVGTGVVGFQVESQHTVKVGGWGFPHDDEIGACTRALHAVGMTLQWIQMLIYPHQVLQKLFIVILMKIKID